MGYSQDLFLDKVSENLLCSICLDVMKDPVSLDKCQHYFCKECIEMVIQNAGNDGTEARCPSDRTVIGQASIRRAAPVIVSIMDDLKMKCKFYPECEETILYKNADQHELDCISNPHNLCEHCSTPLTLATKPIHDCIPHFKERIAQLEEENLKIQKKKKLFENFYVAIEKSVDELNSKNLESMGLYQLKGHLSKTKLLLLSENLLVSLNQCIKIEKAKVKVED